MISSRLTRTISGAGVLATAETAPSPPQSALTDAIKKKNAREKKS